ncbi:hypothetical protein C8R45DRAFT_943391 [Mycena sanguinolenta]|nr:hypothetical protein C8R45DRAFT_943391 [Mycena sanguinolenta]
MREQPEKARKAERKKVAYFRARLGAPGPRATHSHPPTPPCTSRPLIALGVVAGSIAEQPNRTLNGRIIVHPDVSQDTALVEACISGAHVGWERNGTWMGRAVGCLSDAYAQMLAGGKENGGGRESESVESFGGDDMVHYRVRTSQLTGGTRRDDAERQKTNEQAARAQHKAESKGEMSETQR